LAMTSVPKGARDVNYREVIQSGRPAQAERWTEDTTYP